MAYCTYWRNTAAKCRTTSSKHQTQPRQLDMMPSGACLLINVRHAEASLFTDMCSAELCILALALPSKMPLASFSQPELFVGKAVERVLKGPARLELCQDSHRRVDWASALGPVFPPERRPETWPVAEDHRHETTHGHTAQVIPSEETTSQSLFTCPGASKHMQFQFATATSPPPCCPRPCRARDSISRSV